MIEIKFDKKTQETILLGAVRAMSSSPHLNVNAMRREDDAVVMFYDPTRDPATKPKPASIGRRALAWAAPRWFPIAGAPQ